MAEPDEQYEGFLYPASKDVLAIEALCHNIDLHCEAICCKVCLGSSLSPLHVVGGAVRVPNMLIRDVAEVVGAAGLFVTIM